MKGESQTESSNNKNINNSGGLSPTLHYKNRSKNMCLGLLLIDKQMIRGELRRSQLNYAFPINCQGPNPASVPLVYNNSELLYTVHKRINEIRRCCYLPLSFRSGQAINLSKQITRTGNVISLFIYRNVYVLFILSSWHSRISLK